MDRAYLFILVHLSVTSLATADTYSVKIDTEHHVNLVDSRFLSFTIDPKYLFSSSGKYDNKECVCMASSLTPAYLRIAGPSTAHMVFHNATISIEDEGRQAEDLDVGFRQWRKFLQWAHATGFDLVFALNNHERMASGMWDPNTTLNILTVAEKAHVGDIFWQLGYECTNQSIEEYLNDLETLRVIIETFGPGRAGAWRVVGGDVTSCLHVHSKSDFKDYLMLSADMMDAVMLNGNSSSHELARMSQTDRLKVLRALSRSAAPLWLTEPTAGAYSELERAVDWLTSLGYSARNGFAVHFRELLEDEMYEPSLSFYMALLFKNLVGERVLNLEMDPEQAIIFGHCTSLRHQPVPGAVTLYGANMDDEPARFSLKLAKREEGGDILQFILGHDHSGNIIVNGRAMYYEGDIRPVVKRVRPYKTLLINLPPKSFGFWVLANTNIDACQDFEEVTLDKDLAKDVHNKSRIKRSAVEEEPLADVSIDFTDAQYILNKSNEGLIARVNNINSDLKKVKGNFKYISKRAKRQDSDTDSSNKRNFRRLKPKPEKNTLKTDFKSRGIIGNYLQSSRRNLTRIKFERDRKLSRFRNNKLNKRYSKTTKGKLKEKSDKLFALDNQPLSRRRRNVDKPKDYEETSAANEINESGESAKVWKILHKIHKQLKDLSLERDDYVEEEREHDKKHRVIVKTKVTGDSASAEIGDAGSGFIKTTVSNIVDILSDLNDNINKAWNAITFLE